MDPLESLFGFFNVEIIFAGVACEVVEDLSLLFWGDPALFGGASHGSAAFSLVDLTAVVSVDCLEDVFDFETFRDLIGDCGAIEKRLVIDTWCDLFIDLLSHFFGFVLGVHDSLEVLGNLGVLKDLDSKDFVDFGFQSFSILVSLFRALELPNIWHRLFSHSGGNFLGNNFILPEVRAIARLSGAAASSEVSLVLVVIGLIMSILGCLGLEDELVYEVGHFRSLIVDGSSHLPSLSSGEPCLSSLLSPGFASSSVLSA